MSETFFVTGAGWVGANGCGRGFDRRSPRFSFSGGGLPDMASLPAYTMGRRGRLDDYTKLLLTALGLALEDAGMGTEGPKDIGIAARTVLGCLATDREFWRTAMSDGGKFASPSLFAYTLPNSCMGEAAIGFGLTGPTFLLGTGRQDDPALVTAALLELAGGGTEGMLVGFADAPFHGLSEETPALRPGAGFLLVGKDARGRECHERLTMGPNGVTFSSGEPFGDLENFLESLP